MRVEAGVHSEHILTYREQLFRLPVLELEDYLYPGFADQDRQRLPAIREALAGYSGRLVLSGPYVDLNPGSPERLVARATRQRFEQAHDLALALGAVEVVFLSTFIPIIYLAAYEEDWAARSIAFWRAFMDGVDPRLTITLGNTLEFHPDWLARIAAEVGQPNFRLAFDLGHFLVYAQVELGEWLARIGPFCATIYVHSNDGHMDTHAAPGRGMLRREQVAQVARALPAETKFIAKMSDKETLAESVAWMRECAVDG